MEKKSLGGFIAALRKAEGMTQKQLAEKLKVSDKTVSRWERDETSPDLASIPVIADLFGITADELLRGELSSARRSSIPEPQSVSYTGEIREKRNLINVVKTRYAVRAGAALTIAAAGLLIAVVCMETIQLHYYDRAAISFAVAVCACVGAALLLAVSAVSCVAALNREGIEGNDSDRLKRHCVHRTMLIVSGIVELFVLFALYAYGLDWYEMLPLAPLWMLGAGVVCFGVCVLVERRMLARGCEYMEG